MVDKLNNMLFSLNIVAKRLFINMISTIDNFEKKNKLFFYGWIKQNNDQKIYPRSRESKYCA